MRVYYCVISMARETKIIVNVFVELVTSSCLTNDASYDTVIYIISMETLANY